MTTAPFYQTTAWQQLRRKALKRDRYRCRMCNALVNGKGAAHVDHIIARRKAPDLALSLSNVQTLCTHCHNSIKQSHEANDTQAIGRDGFPIGSDWS